MRWARKEKLRKKQPKKKILPRNRVHETSEESSEESSDSADDSSDFFNRFISSKKISMKKITILI